MNPFKFIYTLNETEPEMARREYITRNVLFFSFGVTFSFTLISFILYLFGKMPLDTLLIYSAASIILVVAMFLAEAGFWRGVGIIPPLLMYFPAVNANYIGGIDAPGNFMYALLIIFVAIIYGHRKMWIALVICLTTYLCLAWFISSGYIKPFRTAEVVFVNRVVLTSGFLVGISFMIWLLGRSYRREMDVRIKAEELLNRKNEELGRLNESLRESEELYTKLIASMPDIIVRMNLNGEILFINDVGLQLSGYQGTELIGQNMLSFIAPEDQDKATRNTALMFEKNLGPQEYHLTIKDGRKLLLEVNGAVLRNKDGSPYGFVQVCRDITERKRAEDELKRTNAFLDSIIENVPNMIFLKEAKTLRFVQLNKAGEDLLGYSRDDLLGKNDYDFFPKEQADFFMEKDREVLRWKALEDIREEPIKTRNKGERTLHTKKVPILNADGEPEFLLGISDDITEHKRTEEALKESQAFYHSLVEQLPAGVFRKDPQGRFVFVSPWFCRLKGMKEEEFLGKTPLEVIANETAKPAASEHGIKYAAEGADHHALIMQTGKPVELVEEYTPDADGRKQFVHAIKMPVFNSEGKVIGSQGVLFDITDHKRAEEEKRNLEERLRHAQKMEAIGTLAGGIAHDFNNLLMGIQGYISLMLRDLDPSHPHYERLQRIEEQVQSGADLTKQLLGFARGGRYEVKPINMNDIIEKSSSMFGRTKKEITIHRKYGKDLWTVEVDQGQMEQVFMNLYVNAWQAMPGGGEIYLETGNVLLDEAQTISHAIKPGKYVKISFTDTGTGMDPKTRERIFDPFFTTKGMGRGTGLGLATVYGIIRGHGGMIHVDSELGRGTTFNIYLPASKKEAVMEKKQTGTIARGTGTILLVDDEKMVLEVSKELLESLGYRVYPVGSGQEAIAVFMGKRDEIDLVILDMIMPGMSGGDTFDRLREINPGIKVLLSSGYSIDGEAQRIIERGCNGFIQKPFHLEKLSSKVRDILD